MKNKKAKEQKNNNGKPKQIEKTKEQKNNRKAKQKTNVNFKQKKAKEENVTINKEYEASKLLKIVLIVTVIMAVFYGITIVATNKADKQTKANKIKETAAKAEIQYENIMIGTMLNYPDTYYVLIKKEGDNRLEEYTSLIDSIKDSEDSPTIYSADLSDGFNKNYLAKEANTPTDTVEGFTVTGTVLVKVSDHKIDTIYDNYDSIKNKLNEIV